MATICKSCHAKVIWTTTYKGKTMPLDVMPVGNGNIVLEMNLNGEPVATYVDRKRYGGAGPFYTSHFATCEFAAQHRKGTSK